MQMCVSELDTIDRLVVGLTETKQNPSLTEQLSMEISSQMRRNNLEKLSWKL